MVKIVTLLKKVRQCLHIHVSVRDDFSFQFHWSVLLCQVKVLLLQQWKVEEMMVLLYHSSLLQ